MPNVTLDIYGLDEIKTYLSSDRINKSLAIAVGESVLHLHGVLATSVFARYSRPNDINKALVSKSSIVETGKGFIRNGLEYRDTETNLAQFPYTKEPNTNLNEPKIRKGIVHRVTVKRGIIKKVHGKHGYGGFTQRAGNRVIMYERDQKATWYGKERAPISRLYSINLVSMVKAVYEHDPKVKQALNNLENTIIDRFIP